MHEKSSKPPTEHPVSCLWSASDKTSRKHRFGWFPVVVSMFINLIAFVLIFNSGGQASTTSYSSARRLARLGAPAALNASSYAKAIPIATTPTPSKAAKYAVYEGVDAMWKNSALCELLLPLPDFFGIGQILVAEKRLPSPKELLCEPPDFFFPDFRTLDDDIKDQHFRYYLSAIVLSYWVYAFLGWILTLCRNARCEKVDSHAHILMGATKSEVTYTQLPSQGREVSPRDAGQSGNPFQEFLQQPYFIFFVIFFWFLVYIYAIPLLVRKGCITRSYAFAGEAWLIYLHLHCLFGLLEVGLSANQPEKKLSWKVYPDKMFKNLLPVASEKGDTVKDFMVAALAASENDQVLHWLGIGCFILLFVVHFYFVCDSSTRATMFDAYLPILFAEPEKKPQERVIEYSDKYEAELKKGFQDVVGHELEDSDALTTNELICGYLYPKTVTLKELRELSETDRIAKFPIKLKKDEGYINWAKKQMAKWLLKQSGVAKRRIAYVEDFPQALANLFFQVWQERDAFQKDVGAAVGTFFIQLWRDLQFWNKRKKGSKKSLGFVAFSLFISVLKIVVCQLLARLLKDTLLTYMISERDKALISGNYPKAVDLQKLIWELAEPKDHETDKFREKNVDIVTLLSLGITFKELSQKLHYGGDAKHYLGLKRHFKFKESARDIKELHEAGFRDLRKFREADFSIPALHAQYTATDFQSAGYKAKELKGSVKVSELLDTYGIVVLKENSFDAGDFKADNYKAPDLFKLGFFNIKELKVHFALKEILEGGTIPIKNIKEDGEFTAEDFKTKADYSAGDLFKTECFTVDEFKGVFDLKDILKDKIPVQAVKKGGFTALDFKFEANYTAAQLFETGCFEVKEFKPLFELKQILEGGRIPIKAIKAGGFEAKDFKDKAGYTAPRLYQTGCFTVEELKGTFELKEILKDGIIPIQEVKDSGWTAKHFKEKAGYTAVALWQTGCFKVNELKYPEELFTLREILTGGTIPTKEVADAGYTAKRFKDEAGWSAKQLFEADCFKKKDIIILFTNVKELRSAKIPLQDLKEAGLTVDQLKNQAGFTAAELEEVFDDKELKAANFSLLDLKASNFDVVRLKKKFGFPFRQLMSEGFEKAHIKNGFTVKDLLDDRIALDQIFEVGFNSPEDFSDFKVKKAPTVVARIGRHKEEISPETEGTIEIIKVEKDKVALFINFGDASNSYWKASANEVILKHKETGKAYP